MTLLAWMLYAMLVTSLLAGGAWCLTRGVGRLGLQTRWIWSGAMVLSLVLSLAALPIEGWTVTDEEGAAGAGIGEPTWSLLETSHRSGLSGISSVASRLEAVAAFLNQGMTDALALLPTHQMLDRTLAAAWFLTSALLATGLLGGALRLKRRSRSWRRARVRGREVRVAPEVGPAVFGIRQATIVIPAPLRYEADPQILELVLRHEEEHVRARDPLCLSLALVPLVLVPWNLPLIWTFHRLRDAVELDCDRRVLRAGVSSSAYGEALLQVAAGPRLAVPAAALSPSSSLLERRLKALVRMPRRLTVPRALLTGMVGLALVLLACQTETPTGDTAHDPEVELTGEVQGRSAEETPAEEMGLEDAPRFTPFTDPPVVRNRDEVRQAMWEAYPSPQRPAGLEGMVVVHLYVDEGGEVRNVLIAESSGNDALDEAALEAAGTFAFEPARYEGVPTPVWIQIPMTFQTSGGGT